jgi:hypothetical protein
VRGVDAIHVRTSERARDLLGRRGPGVASSEPHRSTAYHDDFWTVSDNARVVYVGDERVDEVFELFSAPLDGLAPAVSLVGLVPTRRRELSVLRKRAQRT